ncbi:MAG: ABC transporter permease [Acidimicrobiales bacterium]|nr:ABC transporter permease [Hyphomonadaceae bacterium]RZV43264.1 MAG: ABC transporter permease [Acidimicrobiales bacterium]
MSFISAIDRKLIRDLIHLKGQALAVSIIVACGVAIMVMALGTLSSLQQSQETYYDRYRFADVFATVKRAPDSLARRVREIEGVRVAETRISRYATLKIEGFNDPANALLVSVPDFGEQILNRTLMHTGRWPDAKRPDEIVASKSFVDAHGFELGDQLTAIINGRARLLTIVGIGDSPEYIYTLGPGNLLPDDKRFGVFWMRRKALEAAFDLNGAFNDISLVLGRNAKPNSVIDELDRILAPYGGLGAYLKEDQLSNAFIESEMNQLKNMAKIIPPVFLLVSAMLLNALLIRLIATERQQIGLLKAFGYTSPEIAWHYVKLALAITLLGIVMGFGFGAMLARLMTNLYGDTFRFPVMIFTFSKSSFAFSAGAAIIAAVAGALNASLSAARLQPAEAMIPAPPESYRRGPIQKFSARLPFDEPTRMIMRHLVRWPGRGATTLLGVAAAQALLIGTLFMFDSLDVMLDTFFERTDPYEAMVNFVEPIGSNAIEELKDLPGVISVEASRTVAAKIRHGPRFERAGIIGLPGNAVYKQILNENDEVFPVPEEGLTLSSQLAKMLDVGIGDQLTLEILEGRRPTIISPVTAMVNEYISSPAYMNINRLNQHLFEGEVVSGAFIKLDPSQSDQFSKAVLDRPVIASVTLQSAAIKSFEDTLEDTISIMMSIYAVIGGAIAAGVVYNAARISLTERGRELASLRVLGFTRHEVSYILIGELVILVLLALPLGCLFGAALAYVFGQAMSSELFRIPIVIEPATYGVCALIVLVAAIGSAVLVSRRIGQLDMIAVLKTRE